MNFTERHLVGRLDFRTFYETEGVVFRRREALCPFHEDRNPSMSLDLGRGLWNCHACNIGGDAVDFLMRKHGLDKAGAIAELCRRYGIERGNGRDAENSAASSSSTSSTSGSTSTAPTGTARWKWEIRNHAGVVVAVHHREDHQDGKKRFWWERNGANNLGGMAVADLPLYGSERLDQADPETPIIVTEGEKKADALRDHGYVVVATVTGANGTPGTAALEVLRGRDVILWPDHDDVGRDHMTRMAAALGGVAASVRVLTWGERPHDDAFDFFVRGGNIEQLDQLLSDAPEAGSVNSATTADATMPKKPMAETIILSGVVKRPIGWLWPGRIPRGTLTQLDGDPDLAKSTITIDLAARGSREGHTWPDGKPCGGPWRTLLLSAEDPIECVIRPRFDEAGGDPDMVTLLRSVRRGPDDAPDLFALTTDLMILEETAKKIPDLALIVIDPLTAYFGTTINSWKDQEVRRVLFPLAALAERLDVAVLLIRHLNKATKLENVLYRGGGSIGIIGAARSGLLAVRDPDDEERRLLATYKHNLAQRAPTLAYRPAPSLNDPEVPTINWEGIDPRSAEQINAAAGETREQRTARGDARHFLRELLAEGPVSAEDVYAEAKKAGFSKRTIERAGADLGVKKNKTGYQKAWTWSLP